MMNQKHTTPKSKIIDIVDQQQFIQCCICNQQYDSVQRIPMYSCRACLNITCFACLNQKAQVCRAKGTFNKCMYCPDEIKPEMFLKCHILLNFLDIYQRRIKVKQLQYMDAYRRLEESNVKQIFQLTNDIEKLQATIVLKNLEIQRQRQQFKRSLQSQIKIQRQRSYQQLQKLKQVQRERFKLQTQVIIQSQRQKFSLQAQKFRKSQRQRWVSQGNQLKSEVQRLNSKLMNNSQNHVQIKPLRQAKVYLSQHLTKTDQFQHQPKTYQSTIQKKTYQSKIQETKNDKSSYIKLKQYKKYLGLVGQRVSLQLSKEQGNIIQFKKSQVYVDLSKTKVTNDEVEGLCGALTQLTKLNLNGCMQIKSIKLRNCQYLKELSLQQKSLREIQLQQMPSLEKVYLSQCQQLHQIRLTNCQQIKTMYLCGTQITDQDLCLLCEQLQNIQSLSLQRCAKLQEFKCLAKLKKLLFLDLRKTNIQDQDRKYLLDQLPMLKQSDKGNLKFLKSNN